VVVAIATIGICFSIPGQTMGFSVFTDILIEKLGLSRVQLSTAYCIGTVVSGFTLPRLGRLFDLLGARRMTVYSALATGFILFYLSQSVRLADWLGGLLPVARTGIAFVIITLGFYLIRASAQGVLTMTCRNAVGKWFDYHRGNALAVSGVFTAFAFSLAPSGLGFLIDRLGYDGAWGALGITTIVVMGGLGWFFMRDNPEESGLVMDGPTRAGKPRREGHADSITHREWSRSEALQTLPFWAFNLGFSFWSLFGTAMTFHILSIASEVGRTRTEILACFFPMAVLSVVANVVCGWLSPRTKLRHLLVVMNAAALIGVLGSVYLGGTLGLWSWIVGSGITGGCFSALSGIVWPRFFGRRHLGSISGFGMSSMVIASGIGPLLFSLSLNLTGSYVPILWASAVVPLALLVISFRADNPQRA